MTSVSIILTALWSHLHFVVPYRKCGFAVLRRLRSTRLFWSSLKTSCVHKPIRPRKSTWLNSWGRSGGLGEGGADGMLSKESSEVDAELTEVDRTELLKIIIVKQIKIIAFKITYIFCFLALFSIHDKLLLRSSKPVFVTFCFTFFWWIFNSLRSLSIKSL